jgi:hypothetical protein
MASHLYVVGETVALKPHASHFAKLDNVFTVRAHLPASGDGPLYRIKSASEPHERVVEENLLMRLAPIDGPNGDVFT